MNQNKAILELQRQVIENRMSRRRFMQGAMALGVGAMAPALYSEAVRAAPKRGGVYRMGLGGASSSDALNPQDNGDVFMINMNQGAHKNALTEVLADGSVVPELAESLEPSADAATWRVKLRKGITFHSGRDLTPEDVIASIEFHRGEGSTSAAKSVTEAMGEISKDGDTLVFRLPGGNADFPYLLSDYHVLIAPLDRHGELDWNDGTGPYEIVTFEPGVRAIMKRNENFFKPGEGNFDEVHITAINDTAARMNAMITGQVDAIARCDNKTADQLDRRPDVRLLQVTGTRHFAYPMNVNAEPFDNNDLRMALKLGIDRRAFVDTVLRGYGVPGNDHPIAPTQPFHAGDLPQREYDPDRARWHLKRAGFDHLDLEISASEAAYNGAVAATELFAEQLKPAGVNLAINRMAPDGYWESVSSRRTPWFVSYWSGRPTADWMFTVAYSSTSTWNETHWDHARFEALLVAGRAELDPARRGAIYAEMQAILRDEGGTVIPCFANNLDAASTKLGTPDALAGNWELDGSRSASRWWFA